MPTYQYRCRKCGHEFEELQSMKEPLLTRCPNCHTDNLDRVLGTGAGLIFKGSGFYQTDYKKEGGGMKGKKKPSAGEPPKKDEGGSKDPKD